MLTTWTASTQRLSVRARALWAKSGDADGWLTLPQHMLDSACVAEWLWDTWAPDAVRSSITRLCGLDENGARTLAIWMACTHDIGKATVTFQARRFVRPDGGDFTPELLAAGLPVRQNALERSTPDFRHSLASGRILLRWLGEGPHAVSGRIASSLAAVADAHHGIASDTALRETADAILAAYPSEWTDAQNELLEWAAEITGVREVLPRLARRLRGPALNLLTGLVIMADWMASNAEAFPMAVTASQHDRVETALGHFNLTPPWRPPAIETDLTSHMRRVFAWPDDRAPRPIQAAILDSLRSGRGPALVIVEAPTGEGKTEAALIAAEMLAARSGSGGAIIAAPTMSTADGLFQRVLSWTAHSTATGDVTSLFLAHSKNALNPEFRAMRHHAIGVDEEEAPRAGQVIASQWMSGRKKGLLSTFAVATIDQVLLMALQSRHVMLRHLSLAGKVVVIDEVHAYDVYMSEYLHTALAWLARYRVPVVLLSATLPSAQKRALIAAYDAASGFRIPDAIGSAYPLVTIADADGFREIAVDPRPADLHASLEFLEDATSALVKRLRHDLTDGGCALIICNTIRRAQEAYAALRTVFPDEVELHHAGFVAIDRVAKESALRQALGPASHRGAGRPYRRIVVATQVAEQSLDIDADLLVTDIAPIDLIIQRIGRLHRHPRPATDRPDRLREPAVLIRAVRTQHPAPVFDEGTAYVYDLRLLISTLAVLNKRVLPHGFHRPDDIVGLVQTAYRENPPIPRAWADVWREAVEASNAEQENARRRARTYRFPEPSQAGSLDDQFVRQRRDISLVNSEEAGLAQVRDSTATIEVIPIVRTPGGYRLLPWLHGTDEDLVQDAAPDGRRAFTLASSTVRLPPRFGRHATVFDAVLTELEMRTPRGWRQDPLLEGQVALVLDEDLETVLNGRRLAYRRDVGLLELGSASSTPSPSVSAPADTLKPTPPEERP